MTSGRSISSPWDLALAMFPAGVFIGLQVPPLFSLSALVLLTLRFIPALPFRKRVLSNTLSVVFLVLVYFHFQTLLGREASGTFLLILTALKFFEYESVQELNFIRILALLLISTAFLFGVDIWKTLILLGGLTYSIYTFLPESMRRKRPSEAWLFFLKMLLTSLPPAMLLFVVFPRVSDLFWRAQNSQSQWLGGTGFSDEIRPGSVLGLIQSDRLVFRFKSMARDLQLQDLYWRGERLESQKEMHWTRSGPRKWSSIAPKKIPGDFVQYYESIQNPSLFTPHLVLGSGSEVGAETWSTQQVLTKDESSLHKIQSSKDGSFEIQGRFFEESSSMNKEIPANQEAVVEWTPRLQNLFEKFKALKLQRREDIVKHWLDFFLENSFKYTRFPLVNSSPTLDHFLFESRVGYCEHYASALGLLLRMSEVPTRVIVGFQGGEYNSVGGFYSVREKDAHAWVEYLNKDNRWVSLDPTAHLAPLRLSLGIDGFLDLPEDLVQSLSAPESIARTQGLLAELKKVYYFVQNLNFIWTRRISSFDLDAQQRLFQKVLETFNSPLQLIAVLVFLMGVLFGIRKIFNSAWSWFRTESLSRRYLLKYLKAHLHSKDWNWRMSLRDLEEACRVRTGGSREEHVFFRTLEGHFFGSIREDRIKLRRVYEEALAASSDSRKTRPSEKTHLTKTSIDLSNLDINRKG